MAVRVVVRSVQRCTGLLQRREIEVLLLHQTATALVGLRRVPPALHTVLAHTKLVIIVTGGFVSEFLVFDPHQLLQPLHGHADLLLGREVATAFG